MSAPSRTASKIREELKPGFSPRPRAAADESQLPLTPPFADRGGVFADDLDDANGPTSLLQAAARVGDMERALTSINAGAHLDVKDSWGLAPIHSAAILGCVQMVTLLVERRASIDELSSRGTSALHLAAAEGRDEVLIELLRLKADATMPTFYGTTPLQMARRRNIASVKDSGESATPDDIPPGRAERALQRELTRMLRMADEEAAEKRQQLAIAVQAQQRLEKQLGPEAAEALRAQSLPATPREVLPSNVSTVSKTRSRPESGVPSVTTSRPESGVPTLLSSRNTDAGGEAGEWARRTLSASSRPPALGVNEFLEQQRSPQPGCYAVNGALDYWRTMSTAMADARSQGEEAMKRSYLRQLPEKEDLDTFPWTGAWEAADVLAVPDPDDPDIVAGYEWLQKVAKEDKKKFEGQPRRASKERLESGEDYVQKLRDKAMRERTGKTQAEWVDFVYELQESNSPWDWSKIEVRQKTHRCESLSEAGVFAAGEKTEVLFREGDVIGPLSGTLRRKSRYEALYYAQRTWVLHDPGCYELSLRIQTAELKLETLCLDLRAGPGQNRLRYLAETRPDPLGLRALLQLEPDAGPRTVLPPRNRMPRPRSRPTSPDHGYVSRQDPVAMPLTPMAMQAATDDVGKGANVTWAEVLIDGYPYVFVIATRPIRGGEELTVDHSEEYWATQRAMLTRLLEIGRLGHETVVRVNKQSPDQRQKAEEEEPSFELPQRTRMKRVKEDD